MKALIVGCGRVGSALAKRLQKAEWDVVALDESE
jgi:Trk K+ transport system NAD-binding subunit